MLLRFSLLALLLLLTGGGIAVAGGPRWVSGGGSFDPSTSGHPITWRNGAVLYYTDLGDLSPTVSQAQANAMVAAAAAQWASIPTVALQISSAGSLAEDVSGVNFRNGAAGLTMPADVQKSAITTPLGVIYDADGSVLDSLRGSDASTPLSCNSNAVTTIVDNFASDATIAHALMIVNGRCTQDSAHIALLGYMLLRGFGRILGLDWSQTNDQIFPAGLTPEGLLGWPIMHPVEKLCNSNGNPCMPGPIAPRYDDVAALNRLYPLTAANAASFPGKSVTAAATLSIRGTIHFHAGMGMQGVNVVARPILPGTQQPDLRYAVTSVSGSLFGGSATNAIVASASGLAAPFGSPDPALQGWYDLSGIPLPPGVNEADYQLTFEPVNLLYTGEESVGPYALGQVSPSGTMPVVLLHGLTAGAAIEQDETITDSAEDTNSGGDGLESLPVTTPLTGEWLARISQPGHGSWLRWHMRAGRQVTVEAEPLDERGLGTESKARIVAGVWNADDPLGSAPAVSSVQPFNTVLPGLTSLSFQSGNDGDVRIELADQRADGRPDYLYGGRVLYADTVTPNRISVSGGPIVLDGSGFRPGNTVSVGGVAASITSISSTEITAIAPASSGGMTGNVDVTVTDPNTHGWTTIGGLSGTGLSYGPQADDQISIVAAPLNAVPLGVPEAFEVRAFAAGGSANPAPGISVTYTVTIGEAELGCGRSSCTVTTGGDGLAAMSVTPTSTSRAVVLASLPNGASVVTAFTGASAPTIAALGGTLYLAAGSAFSWSPQTIVLSNALPYPNQLVTWTTNSGATIASASSLSGPDGIAWTQVTAGALTAGSIVSISACLSGAPAACASFQIVAVDPAIATLVPLTAIDQVLAPGNTVPPVVLRVVDPIGHPIANAPVLFYETLHAWSPACPLQGSCPTAHVLATRVVQESSTGDGIVSVDPLTDGIVPTRLALLATAGAAASIEFTLERHP